MTLRKKLEMFRDGLITIHFQNGIKEISPPLRGVADAPKRYGDGAGIKGRVILALFFKACPDSCSLIKITLSPPLPHQRGREIRL
jgi:hypothetical protein